MGEQGPAGTEEAGTRHGRQPAAATSLPARCRKKKGMGLEPRGSTRHHTGREKDEGPGIGDGRGPRNRGLSHYDNNVLVLSFILIITTTTTFHFITTTPWDYPGWVGPGQAEGGSRPQRSRNSAARGPASSWHMRSAAWGWEDCEHTCRQEAGGFRV